MKTKRVGVFQGWLYSIAVLSVVIFASIAFCETSQGIHIRTWMWEPPRREFKFRDVPCDMPFIKAFPMEALLKDSAVKAVEQVESLHETYFVVNVAVGEGETEKVRLAYWIYTSVSDAEEAIVERLCSTNLWMGNAIDLNRAGEIGDNCWYGGYNFLISFIRNNVRVDVTANTYSSNPNVVVLSVAKKVDALLCGAEKVADVGLIPAPIIKSVEIISGSPQVGKLTTLKVDAVDPSGQRLTFRCLGAPPSTTSETSIVSFPPIKFAGLHKIKIWVMNEDRIVSSVEKEVSF